MDKTISNEAREVVIRVGDKKLILTVLSVPISQWRLTQLGYRAGAVDPETGRVYDLPGYIEYIIKHLWPYRVISVKAEGLPSDFVKNLPDSLFETVGIPPEDIIYLANVITGQEEAENLGAPSKSTKRRRAK